jgi:hypothetical protein
MIKLQANEAGSNTLETWFNIFGLASGGGAFEDTVWNNVLKNVAADCNKPKP